MIYERYGLQVLALPRRACGVTRLRRWDLTRPV
jgi:hypothetical protein